jgi:predicted kinase
LRKGVSVVLDATNLSEANREYLYNIAETAGAHLIIVRTTAPEEVIKQRLTTRQTRPGEKSDADWQVYQRLKAEVEPIKRQHYTADSSRDIAPVIGKIIKEVNRRRRS